MIHPTPRKLIPASNKFQVLKNPSQVAYITMKTIMIFIFVLSLDVLTLWAEKTSQNEETGAFTLNDDPSGAYQSAGLKRQLWKRHSAGHWRKANTSPVCFGAKNTQFGKFYAPKKGELGAIKLVHLYGYVSCSTGSPSYWAYWGCNEYNSLKKMVNVVITTAHNHILLPPSQFTHHTSAKWSKIPGYDSLSPELFLSVVSHPISVGSGQQLRLWYGEDLMKTWEGDNGGRVCCDVYALYV